jgi:hypothetical protein
MSYFLPDGAKLYMNTTFDAAKTVSAVTNANPAVATSTAHGLANGDELLFTSGWEDATDSIWRGAGVATNTINLEGLDASNTTNYTAGGGVGTVAKVTGWTELQQWLESADQGGGARFVDVNPISRRNGIKLPAGFEAAAFELQFGYDQALASQIAMIAASRTGTKKAFKVVAPGMVGYFYGYMSFNEMPTLGKGSVMSARASVAVLGRFTSY